MSGKFDYIKEIEKLKKSKDYGVSRVEQLQEERKKAEIAESKRHARESAVDDDDFIDNTGEDLVKNMRKVKIDREGEGDYDDEGPESAFEGPLAQGFRNVKVSAIESDHLGQT
jgi:hypothetical protein